MRFLRLRPVREPDGRRGNNGGRVIIRGARIALYASSNFSAAPFESIVEIPATPYPY